MAEEKAPRPKVDMSESGTPAPARPEPERGSEPKDGEGAAQEGGRAVSSWVSKTFPGHEKAFWGGMCGLVVALAVFVIGVWRTVLIVALVLVGVAVGQLFDGDPKIINLVRRFLSRNQ